MAEPLLDVPPGEVDVVVVGSGATGSNMAARLAEGGKKVVILEAGPARTATDLVSSTLHARRVKWTGPPVLDEGNNPVGFVFNSGFGTGGSAMHHYAVWPRFHPEDFQMHSRYGRGLDWPLSYAELSRHYDEVQTEAGIAGDATRETWRPPGAPYPLPGVPVYPQGELIARGFAKLGKKVAPLPLAVTSAPYNGRPTCLWDGWCDSGCPIGALANPLTIHLPRARSAGAVLVNDAAVTKVLTSPDGTRAVGVEYARKGGASTGVLHAKMVVLAAFAVQNPRLLLASASDKHPRGLGNSSGLLGRYIMTHAAGLVYGLFDEETQPYMGAFGGQLVNQDSYPKTTHGKSGAFGSYQWMIAQAVKPNDLLGISTSRAELFGPALHDFMKRAARGFAGMTAVVEDLPVAENRVTLADTLDANGVPLARVVHDTHPDSAALWRAALAEGKEVMIAAGARESWSGQAGSMHIMGGTIMGKSAADSVTNSYGQLHDVPNVVIAGPGLFPTSAGVNPTFTAHALAARSAELVLAQWGRIAG